MDNILDSPLLTIIVIVTVATVLALIRALKRDRCLLHFDDYRATLAEKDGDVTWGNFDVQASGLEITYPHPKCSRKGFWQQSFLYYRDQYESMDGVYRSTSGLPEEQKESRLEYLEKTSNPRFYHRLYRQIRNWIGMIRDAVVQAVSLAAGAARSRGRPAGAILTQDEERLSTLSGEIVGHSGNAYDPLLERHLFTRVIIDINRGDGIRQYCGYLADYTEQFLEIIDAEVNASDHAFEPSTIPAGTTHDGVEVRSDDGQLIIENNSGGMLIVDEIDSDGEILPVGAVVPDDFIAALWPGNEVQAEQVQVAVSSAERIDMLVPRSHAIVRHGVSGLTEDELQFQIEE